MKIKETVSGNNGVAVFYYTGLSAGRTKHGALYYDLALRDNTGTARAKIWDADKLGMDLPVSGYLKASFTASEYQGEIQFVLSPMECVSNDAVDQSEYFPTSPENVDNMFALLLKYLDKVTDPDFRRLNDTLLHNDVFIENVKGHSAAVSVHHAFVGGWLQHTLSVIKLCYAYTKQYKSLNSSLLLTAAFLHDVGKFMEITAFPENQCSVQGAMFGHVVQGVSFVEGLVEKIPDFPLEKKDHLCHCIVAHHGKLEWGSPHVPVTMEALALHLADYTDSRIEIMSEALEGAEDGQLTGYNKFLETRLLITPVW